MNEFILAASSCPLIANWICLLVVIFLSFVLHLLFFMNLINIAKKYELWQVTQLKNLSGLEIIIIISQEVHTAGAGPRLPQFQLSGSLQYWDVNLIILFIIILAFSRLMYMNKIYEIQTQEQIQTLLTQKPAYSTFLKFLNLIILIIEDLLQYLHVVHQGILVFTTLRGCILYYSRQLYKTKHVIDQTHWGSLAPRSVITIDAFVVLYNCCSGTTCVTTTFTPK